MTEDISVGFQNYDPYVQGWYLLPIEAPLSVPYGISGLTSGQIDVLNSHTIQGLIELVYVRVGNDVLFGGLDGLDRALEVTTQTLNILSAVQELHNALVVSSLGNFSAWFKYEGDYSSQGRYSSNYTHVASAFFGVPIVPDFIFSSADAVIQQGGQDQSYASFAQKLADVRDELSAQVQSLSDLASGTPDFTDPNSLYNTSKQVLDDMPPIVTGASAVVAWSAAKLWALDFYGAWNGKDLAQNEPGITIITYAYVPSVWKNTSLRKANQQGLGTGYKGAVQLTPGQSIRLLSGTGGGNTPTAGNTIILTFSGRLAINVEYSGGGTVRSGYPPTVLIINPVDEAGNVVNPIESVAGSGASSAYIGTFNDPARGNVANAGLFEQNITLAITAAQGLNNTQTEEVRAYLFTFEEYYKSASSLLSSITQLVQKYAQGIRPA